MRSEFASSHESRRVDGIRYRNDRRRNGESGPRGIEEEVPDVKEYAESEFRKIGESVALIEKLKKAGKITEEQARIHLEIQKNAARTVLLTLEGLGAVIVERAINAAIGAVRKTVNSALGWKLI